MAQTDFKPITHQELLANEYFDVHKGVKQKPYSIKLVGSVEEKSSRYDNFDESDESPIAKDVCDDDMEETKFCLVNK